MSNTTIKYLSWCLIAFLAGCVSVPEASRRNEIADSFEDKRDIEFFRRDAEAGVWIKTLPDENADYGRYPKDYESIVHNHLSLILKDPNSVRISKITKPRKEHKITDKLKKEAVYGYSTCVWLNAKNSYGGYVGENLYWFLIRNDYVTHYDIGSAPIYIGRGKNCKDGDD